LNDDGNSTLLLDSITEELLASIANNVAEIEQKILVIGNDMDRNKIEKNMKANKPLKRKKRRLTAKKNEFEKQ
jgi:hypothetical protein